MDSFYCAFSTSRDFISDIFTYQFTYYIIYDRKIDNLKPKKIYFTTICQNLLNSLIYCANKNSN